MRTREGAEAAIKEHMEKVTSHRNSELAGSETPSMQFEAPSYQEISLSCEISAYAPDGDDQPLF